MARIEGFTEAFNSTRETILSDNKLGLSRLDASYISTIVAVEAVRLEARLSGKQLDGSVNLQLDRIKENMGKLLNRREIGNRKVV